MRKKLFSFNFIKIVLLFFFIFLAARIVFDFEGIANLITDTIKYISNILSYFIWGFSIAYVLNPLMNFFNGKLKFLDKYKFKKGLVVSLVYILTLGFIVLLFVAIVPVVSNSLKDLAGIDYKTYIENLEKTYNNLLNQFNVKESAGLAEDFGNLVDQGLSFLTQNLNNTLKWLGAASVSTINVILRLIFGFVLSIYMLISKEQMIESSKNIVNGLMKPEKAEKILALGSRVNKIFSNYLVGKIIDSILNGVLAFIGLTLIGVPYTLLISIIIAVTNMVPYFGAFIGGFLAALIVLFSQPNIMLVVWTILFDLLIQQLDSWLIAPKILENQMGISPILIIAGITIGGSLFGFVGMILGVPIVAVIKEIFYDDYIMNRIKIKKAHKSVENKQTN